MSRVIKFLALTLIVAFAAGLPLGLVSCAETQTEKLQILSHSMTTGEYGEIIVKGTAKNVSSSTLSLAQVEVKFYDAEGNLLETLADVIFDLAPGETWRFEIRYFEENVQSYKIGVGEAW